MSLDFFFPCVNNAQLCYLRVIHTKITDFYAYMLSLVTPRDLSASQWQSGDGNSGRLSPSFPHSFVCLH